MNNHAIKTGLIVGVINIVLYLTIYIVDYTIMANWWLGFLLLGVAIAIVCYFGVQYRTSIGGFLEFGKAWVYSIIALAISGILGTIFSVVLYTVIDPELPGLLTEAIVEKSEKMMASFGMPDDQIEEQMEKIKEDTRSNFSALGFVKSYFISLIGYAVFALLSGAIIKKKEPAFEE